MVIQLIGGASSLRTHIQFLRGQNKISLSDFHPTMTVLEYLRSTERSKGTKEGCAEGDCGACTVAIGRVKNGKLVYHPINACIHFVGMLDGCQLLTVEDLHADGHYHAVQQAMIEHHASQCGFCTPGIVMALFTMFHAGSTPVTKSEIRDWLAGNLCRCTGYRPIVDAAFEVMQKPANDHFSKHATETVHLLDELNDRMDVFVGDDEHYFASPGNLTSLTEMYKDNPDALLVNGATDIGLWVTKQLRSLPALIHLGRVHELTKIEQDTRSVTLGAAVTYADSEKIMADLDCDLAALWKRIGAKQVRACGTVGGNIANGSPIGDTPPVLIALNAEITLRHGATSRTIPLDEYFIAYGKQDRKTGELLVSIKIPRPQENQHFRCFKITKRFDQDISAVMAGFLIDVSDGVVTKARIAFGGMAATPARAHQTENALVGASLDAPDSWNVALEKLEQDFTPLSDMRASAEYRSEIAKNLLLKTLIELAGDDQVQTRLTGKRVVGHAAS